MAVNDALMLRQSSARLNGSVFIDRDVVFHSPE